jgi:predicted metal-dependent phosphoesterase TrpH
VKPDTGSPEAGEDPAAEVTVDLHVHSTASDGTVPPAEVVRRAASAGLGGIALTDHDTVAGIEEARTEAGRHGLAFLSGAELSANEPGRSVHLLAYGFDLTDGNLLAFFEEYGADRRRRARDIVGRLQGLGVQLLYEEVAEQAGAAAPTRAHVARALVRHGHVSSEDEVFRRYLSRGRPGYVEKRPTPPAEVIDRVHRAGGVVLLAHPGRAHGPAEVRRWVAEGLDGVEVRHPNNSPQVRQRMAALVKELGLLRSGGSDWHGPGTRKFDLGGESVPIAWMREIETRCRALST